MHTHTHTYAASLKAGLQLMIPEERLSVICLAVNLMPDQQAPTSAVFPSFWRFLKPYGNVKQQIWDSQLCSLQHNNILSCFCSLPFSGKSFLAQICLFLQLDCGVGLTPGFGLWPLELLLAKTFAFALLYPLFLSTLDSNTLLSLFLEGPLASKNSLRNTGEEWRG